MSTKTAPFKFLDAYKQEDNEVFFGREQETEDLYEALTGVKQLLVYGPSGAGKTSLIECGLRNQFSDADWYAIPIRRGNNINKSVFAAINEALQNKITLTPETGLPEDKDIGFGQAIEQLFSERFQPIYFLFDQFEELLLMGSQNEKVNFFERLNELICYRVPARVLLIMREEFVGHLSEFEQRCPSLFQNRFRLEKMGRSNVRDVIFQILEAAEYEDYFQVADSNTLADSILSKLPDQKKEIELTHVQVFLSELWERALGQQNNNALPILNQSLIRTDDNLEGVLDAFLKKQMESLEGPYGEKVPLEILSAMVSERHTKLQVSEPELAEALKENNVQLQEPIASLISELEQRRILRTIRSGEENRYEISHDLLAYVVGQNLTEEMQLREKASDIYRIYTEREGYFTQQDLDYLRPYQQYKPYPPVLEEQIKASEVYFKLEQELELKAAKERAEKEQALRKNAESSKQEAEKNEQKAKQRTKVASIIAVFAMGAAILAGIFFQNAKNQQRIAKEQTRRAQENEKFAEEQKNIAIFEKQRSDSLLQVAENQLLEIQRQQGIIILEKENTRKALTEAQNKEQARLEEQQKRRDAERMNIDTKIKDIETLLRLKKTVDTLRAKKMLDEALKLAPNNPKLKTLQKRLN